MDPDPRTLRELVIMADARSRETAYHTASIVATLLNCRPGNTRFISAESLLNAKSTSTTGHNAGVPTTMRELAPMFKGMIRATWRRRARKKGGKQ